MSGGELLGVHGKGLPEGRIDVETSPRVGAVVAKPTAAAAAVGAFAWLCSEVVVALGGGVGLAGGLGTGAIPGLGAGVILGAAGIAGLYVTGGGHIAGASGIDVLLGASGGARGLSNRLGLFTTGDAARVGIPVRLLGVRR